jgi:hypothetical protein
MSVDLSGYQTAVGVCQCVRLDIPNYTVLRLSTYHKAIMITEPDGIAYEYEPAGVLMSISEGVSELRASSVETSVALSGIPIQYAEIVQAQRIKGSRLDVYRVFTDPVTDAVLAIAGNPVFMFRGIVSNYGFSEQFNEFSNESSLVVNLSCTSLVDMLNTKIQGRRTNSESMRQFYPNDTSFDRIVDLIGRPFDFGGPIKSGQSQPTQTNTNTGGNNNTVQQDNAGDTA